MVGEPPRELNPRYVEQLLGFVEKNGHARVPYRVPGLGPWVSGRRKARRAGRMDPQTVKWFESVPGWEWEGTLPAGVDGERRQHLEASLRTGWGSARAMEAFDAFVAREGHAHIPIDHVEGDFKLGRWVMVQRDQYRTGQMSEERREVLESAPGWRWNGRVNSREEKLQALDAYVGRVGDAKVPNAHVEDGVALGQWVGAQRVAHKAGKLPAEFEARLEAYPGWEWRSTRTQ